MKLAYRGLQGHFYYSAPLYCYIGELQYGEEVISFCAPTKEALFLVMEEAVKAHLAVYAVDSLAELA